MLTGMIKGLDCILSASKCAHWDARVSNSMFTGIFFFSRCSEGKLSVPPPLPLRSAPAAYLIVGRQV